MENVYLITTVFVHNLNLFAKNKNISYKQEGQLGPTIRVCFLVSY